MQIRSMGVTALVVACGSIAVGQGNPAETELRYEVRRFDAGHNNGWASSLNALPGDRIEVRAMVSYVGTAPVIALGQITFQPTVSNWTAGDNLLTNYELGQSGTHFHPYGIGSSGGYLSTPPAGVPDAPGLYGRAMPFTAAAVTIAGNDFHYRGHTQNVGGVSYLRIARSDVTNWIGVGPSSGSAAINNVTGAGGVTCWQGSLGSSRDPNAPPPLIRTENIFVFKFGFVLSTSPSSRSLVVDTPPLGFGRRTSASDFGGPSTGWFMNTGEIGIGSQVTNAFAVPATIHVVPSPASMMVGVVGMLAVRLRRVSASW